MSNSALYSKLSVLAVDDHKTMVMLVKGLLKDIGFVDIDVAPDGVSALRHLQQKKYDLVISDWNMPNMDGLELLKKVRGSSNGPIRAIPFILLTAEAKKENIIAAKQAGVNNYIIKPLTAENLKQKIDITLGLM